MVLTKATPGLLMLADPYIDCTPFSIGSSLTRQSSIAFAALLRLAFTCTFLQPTICLSYGFLQFLPTYRRFPSRKDLSFFLLTTKSAMSSMFSSGDALLALASGGACLQSYSHRLHLVPFP